MSKDDHQTLTPKITVFCALYSDPWKKACKTLLMQYHTDYQIYQVWVDQLGNWCFEDTHFLILCSNVWHRARCSWKMVGQRLSIELCNWKLRLPALRTRLYHHNIPNWHQLSKSSARLFLLRMGLKRSHQFLFSPLLYLWWLSSCWSRTNYLHFELCYDIADLWYSCVQRHVTALNMPQNDIQILERQQCLTWTHMTGRLHNNVMHLFCLPIYCPILTFKEIRAVGKLKNCRMNDTLHGSESDFDGLDSCGLKK